jgi:hypothetical protein
MCMLQWKLALLCTVYAGLSHTPSEVTDSGRRARARKYSNLSVTDVLLHACVIYIDLETERTPTACSTYLSVTELVSGSSSCSYLTGH